MIRSWFLRSTHIFFCSTLHVCCLELHAHHISHIFYVLHIFSFSILCSSLPMLCAHHSLLVFYTLPMYFLLFMLLMCFLVLDSRSPCVFYVPSIVSIFLGSAHVFLRSMRITIRMCFLCIACIFFFSMLCAHHDPPMLLHSMHIFVIFVLQACFLMVRVHHGLPISSMLHPYFLLFHAPCMFSYTLCASRSVSIFHALRVFSFFTLCTCFLVLMISTLHVCFLMLCAYFLFLHCVCFLALCMHHCLPVSSSLHMYFLLFHAPRVFSCAPPHHSPSCFLWSVSIFFFLMLFAHHHPVVFSMLHVKLFIFHPLRMFSFALLA